MFKNKWVLGGVISILLITIFYSLNTEIPYEQKIENQREEYKQSMLSMEESPIDLNTFEHFDYFSPNEKFIFKADFEPSTDETTFSITMTDSSSTQIPIAGIATFTIDNQEVKLFIFDEGETYLLPFTDQTNTKTTYGGGRYLNIDKKNLNNGKVTIDFNEAHNFYCAYNFNYICPIPPKENHIKTEIKAGEMDFGKH